VFAPLRARTNGEKEMGNYNKPRARHAPPNLPSIGPESDAPRFTGPLAAKELFSIRDFCGAVGIGMTRAYELINRGDVETVLIGQSRRITRRSAEAWLARLPRTYPKATVNKQAIANDEHSKTEAADDDDEHLVGLLWAAIEQWEGTSVSSDIIVQEAVKLLQAWPPDVIHCASLAVYIHDRNEVIGKGRG
jgi:hypothetical protein